MSAGTVSTGVVLVGGQISLYLRMERVCLLSMHSRCLLLLDSVRRRGGADLALLTDGARVLPTEYALTLLTFTRLAGVVGSVFADLSLLAAHV